MDEGTPEDSDLGSQKSHCCPAWEKGYDITWAEMERGNTVNKGCAVAYRACAGNSWRKIMLVKHNK